MDLHDRLARITKAVEQLEMDKLLQRDEIRSLKAQERAYQSEISLLSRKVQEMEAQARQDAPVTDVGKQVRLRYLEQHRQHMGRPQQRVDYDRIKCGNRAAHRGRPVVDALLCLTDSVHYDEVYMDLYGITPRVMKEMMDVPEVVEVVGFRASLQSEDKLTPSFQSQFQRLLEIVLRYPSTRGLMKAFKEDKNLQQCHSALQDCYDSIMAIKER
ncbi:hypothetical protein EPUS_03756 [Endocarpon pusillum Z07020]|uniref:Uncharacterized protein n=1 Tax=Endocarpon pusillum (strain Z07020 / HMAS-L-300199) TaxID=1263415 RepID=U1G8X6_ENDPU|nr:uncharacterized protein EPUS_03756 [Endocarpon pusillum Z07020]ERF68438.1 hypothetical protein EPUS_03756 [Endocarpon pusillum Z07020]